MMNRNRFSAVILVFTAKVVLAGPRELQGKGGM
jgi:hypothetical protein